MDFEMILKWNKVDDRRPNDMLYQPLYFKNQSCKNSFQLMCNWSYIFPKEIMLQFCQTSGKDPCALLKKCLYFKNEITLQLMILINYSRPFGFMAFQKKYYSDFLKMIIIIIFYRTILQQKKPHFIHTNINLQKL